jgi:peptidoglycan/LPS O-acetylase OafA/YrhL
MICVALRKTGWFSKRSWSILGGVTYPLYLLHQNIGYRIFDIGLPLVNRWVLLFFVLTVMLLLSYVVYAQVERRVAPSIRTILSGGRTSVS